MTTHKEEVERELEDALNSETRQLFPNIYEGFREMDALAQGEDALLNAMKEGIRLYFRNRNLQTLTEQALETFENNLNLQHHGTDEARTAAVMNKINTRFVLNDESLHVLCQSIAPDFTVYERTDPQALTLGVFTAEDGEDGELPVVGIVDEIRPTVPQNLALYAGVETSFERGIAVNHAHFSGLWAGLGKVERHEPNITMRICGGVVTSDSSTELEIEKPDRITLGSVQIDGGTLTANSIIQSGIVESTP